MLGVILNSDSVFISYLGEVLVWGVEHGVDVTGSGFMDDLLRLVDRLDSDTTISYAELSKKLLKKNNDADCRTFNELLRYLKNIIFLFTLA